MHCEDMEQKVLETLTFTTCNMEMVLNDSNACDEMRSINVARLRNYAITEMAEATECFDYTDRE